MRQPKVSPGNGSGAIPQGGCDHPGALFNSSYLKAFQQQGNLSWAPPPERFLLMHCQYGRISNRLICFRNFLLYAGLLNRTLLVIINPNEIHYRLDRHWVFDFNHTRSCLGNATVMSTSEYQQRYNSSVVVDEMLCWTCPISGTLKPLEVYFPEWKSVKFAPGLAPKPARLPDMTTTADFLAKLGSATGRVLYIGQMFGGRLKEYENLDNYGDTPFIRSPQCSSWLALQPLPEIVTAAQQFVRDELGGAGSFFAVHLRRGDFGSYCAHRLDLPCNRPTSEVGQCLRAKIMAYNLTKLYISTNANVREIAKLVDIIQENNGPQVHVVRVMERKRNGGAWLQTLQKARVPLVGISLGALEKLICAYGGVYIGTPHSTFSMDIERMRYGFGTANCHDSYLCSGVLY